VGNSLDHAMDDFKSENGNADLSFFEKNDMMERVCVENRLPHTATMAQKRREQACISRIKVQVERQLVSGAMSERFYVTYTKVHTGHAVGAANFQVSVLHYHLLISTDTHWLIYFIVCWRTKWHACA
jgi:hypothetical protein